MTGLTLKEIRKSYGSVDVLHGIDLEINQGEFIVFVGPSGCGKSTLLRMIAGLENITGGEMYIDGQLVNDVPPSKRGIAMVFQSYALYPHMTVFDNMAFGMKIAGESKQEIDRRVRAAADSLQLTNYLDRLPKALSGGQRQRVAIGRAICRDPKVFLFDEPLSNLDAALRVATRIEIARLNEQMADTTMIYVTHDQVEAMTLADRIVVLSAGHIEQVGAPLELYERPANLFVAKFIGSPAMNIIPSTISKAGPTTTITLKGGRSVTLDIATPVSENGKTASFGVRPEDLQIANGDDYIFEGEVSIVEALGEVTLLYIEGLVPGEPIIAKLPGITDIRKGQKMRFAADRSKLHLFDAEGHTYRS
ncbi:alpha-glucoside ABC transporter ATP-binding protein AglK [Rhizobium etli 8C-3]|uniref:Maltose ABC transporter ATP-binding protein /trehalose ABC transporter ATP-binding protein /sucrose ABC transporter ATP-binding protein n=2 Tax=Rhizobium TaxID=379 RepID=A0A4R3RZ27_9HYPH|nr:MULTISPECIES: sn-glycerol-3-phosphate ABC transporter ATP-binding protein UgpC [Rhizobium]APO73591.1 alpha-glucoside ABC transporter ATP-binding protein AglK [Rhizobium etli 8C-3]TCU28066.1 maltose ABC transporter ATP-binding protein /trehalose ABC transporter ATP-binding protein /sucrose ABC transporter ATP-binding protein [Rhizobium azibense]TCU37136.1 maltose ABC transporter ATP-binding protein /trehalose ABC transporter ATP-binding protein /sucrose ABC transporter ATP-binding protein [Rhi